ncbi:Uncharacterized conserved protein, contains LGFP repeats [Geodermatophilus pulveris]|uniref:Uncharacterized conserved protein, contains LGFP repeats n=1 Tax=Geodermatophilus pulveris TaxID=1564159 RepID=A0A239B2E8_9ACTN|nr:hypothetical protein [Geodermatophilus pulveris]SNS01418.1 Uncharacterized conserved protein, contains LGFP repeats [Geodermatophilus pulveris]
MTSRLRLVATCLLALGLAFVATGGSAPPLQPDLTESAELGLFDPGNIIDDDLFYNAGAMDAAQIQGFLVTKGSACSGDLCLKNLRQDTWSRTADQYCAAYAGRERETAAEILAKVSRACGVNPQVLLVLLQKEQGLIRTAEPTERKLRIAVGYGCPDTAPCDAQYYGFYNQLYHAAHRFQYYRANPAKFGHRAGVTNNVRYHPNADCGTLRVYIQNQATAGLYNYTPYTPNKAALDAGYGTGDACSAYGNRNFFSYFTDWFGSTQSGPASIDDKYTHLRASGVDLGGSTSRVTCDQPHGGCYRSYQGGTIFWSRDTGPHVVRGAILERYLSLGGPRLLGYPTGDDTAAPFGTGWYTDFQGGAIYWSSATGAREVRGVLLATWRAKNAQAGVLGYPVGGDEAVPGGFRTRFQGGTLYWSATTGARMLRGALLARYESAGGPRALGFPTRDDGPTRGGATVELQGGAIYWSPDTGAHVVRGAVLRKWRQWGAESGQLGYPTGGETAVASGVRATFTGGDVFWSSSTGARVLRGPVLQRYLAHGGPRVLGFPTTHDVAAAGGGRRAELQGGAVYWSRETGAHVVRGDILARWRQLGGESGRLGYPIGSDAATARGGYVTAFRNGTIYWSRSTGPKVLRGAILRRYEAHGGPGVLGFPTADEVSIRGGARAELQGGAVYWSPETGAHVVRGDILARWRQLGGESGRLGYPIGSDAATARGGYVTAFRNGTIYWSRSTGPKVLRGAILRRYEAHGGPGVLGFPTADEVSIRGGARAELQGGAVYWSPETGARVVEAPAARAYADMGGPASWLGFVTRDTRAVSGGRRTDFQGGHLLVTADGRVTAHRG